MSFESPFLYGKLTKVERKHISNEFSHVVAHFYSSRRRCLGEPRMFVASCLVLSRQETLSATIASDCVCVSISLARLWHVSSVCRVLFQLQHGRIVSVFSTLQK